MIPKLKIAELRENCERLRGMVPGQLHRILCGKIPEMLDTADEHHEWLDWVEQHVLTKKERGSVKRDHATYLKLVQNRWKG